MQFLYIAIAIIVLFAALKIFSLPLKIGAKLLINIICGIVLLIVFNVIGTGLGIVIGLTWFNIGVVAVLGVPGFAALLMMQWIFR